MQWLRILTKDIPEHTSRGKQSSCCTCTSTAGALLGEFFRARSPAASDGRDAELTVACFSSAYAASPLPHESRTWRTMTGDAFFGENVTRPFRNGGSDVQSASNEPIQRIRKWHRKGDVSTALVRIDDMGQIDVTVRWPGSGLMSVSMTWVRKDVGIDDLGQIDVDTWWPGSDWCRCGWPGSGWMSVWMSAVGDLEQCHQTEPITHCVAASSADNDYMCIFLVSLVSL